MNNVFANPKYADVVKEMKLKMEDVRKKNINSNELSNGYIQLYKDKGWIE